MVAREGASTSTTGGRLTGVVLGISLAGGYQLLLQSIYHVAVFSKMLL